MKRKNAPFMPFIVLFIIVPLVELFIFLEAADAIGILQTLLLCVVTAIIGGMLVKTQGLMTLLSAQQNLRSGKLPVQEIFDGFCLIIAGALLLTPGFFTDFIGFFLLIPYFRQFLREFLIKSGKFSIISPKNSKNDESSDIIDGDYQDVTIPPEKLDSDNKSV